MALSYLRDAKTDAGLLPSQAIDMTESGRKRLNNNNNKNKSNNNNNNNNNNNDPSRVMFPVTAAGISIMTPEQLFNSTAALLAVQAVGLPSLANPIYHQNFFGHWPPLASSPPSPLHHQPGPTSPSCVMSTRSMTQRTDSTSSTSSNNNNNNNNNNNIVSGKAEARTAKKAEPAKRKSGKSKAQNSAQTPLENRPVLVNRSPSISPEGGRDKIFTCRMCSRSFGYKHVLQNHERTHTGEKPFQCSECYKRFTRDHHLKTHMRLHTGEKPYHCIHCDRQFVQVANLRRHLRVHTGERPYVCEICSSKFSDSNQLKAHLLIHKGEKPFVCDQCHMRFRRRHHLLHHKCAPNAAALSNSPSSQVSPSQPMVNGDRDKSAVTKAEDGASGVQTRARPIIAAGGGAIRRTPLSPLAGTMPLNLPTAIPIDLPEQTEPEDLSMSTGMRLRSSGSGSGSSFTSSSTDFVHEEDDEDDNDMEKELEAAAGLYLRQPRAKYSYRQQDGRRRL